MTYMPQMLVYTYHVTLCNVKYAQKTKWAVCQVMYVQTVPTISFRRKKYSDAYEFRKVFGTAQA